MSTIPVFEAKNRFSELIARVEAGEEIAITRRGTQVARLVAAVATDPARHRTDVDEAFGRLRELRQKTRLDGDLKSLARQGLD